MLRNQAQALLRHERIHTTVARAKELRPFVERLITVAKRGLAAADSTGRALAARRLVRADVADRDVAAKLFESIAPRFAARPGGYTRVLRVGFRRGDNAELAQVELVGSEYNPALEAEKPAEPQAEAPTPKKGVTGRLRAAAERFRGKKEAVAERGTDETREKRAKGRPTLPKAPPSRKGGRQGGD